MSVAVYIHQASEAHKLVSWGIRFARADMTNLIVVVPRRQKQAIAKFDSLELSERGQSKVYNAVFEAIESHSRDEVVLKELISSGVASSDHDRVLIETMELVAQQPEDAFVEEIAQMDITRLILPVASEIKPNSNEAEWSQRLYERAPCETMMVRGGPPVGGLNVLVVCHQEGLAESALKRACSLAGTESNGSVNFLFVRPNDDEVAESIAEVHTQKILSKLGSSGKAVQTEIVLDDSLIKVLEEKDLAGIDLVLIGTRHLKTMKSFFRFKVKNTDGADDQSTVGEKMTALATMRPAVPLGNRVKRNLQAWIRRVVPQLDKADRVQLVDRLQTGSSFDFDFVSLISLSTIIAALGLLDNSAAVVIGAMLVAPLMTPLVGMGFALIQANERLFKTSIKSVCFGFAVAFGISALLGLLVTLLSSLGISPEMASRDTPSLVDLFVALFSGVAGAYAMSRPNLLSALPGVAIAAALVPPIATSGMALTMGDFVLSGGAALLFFTNIVAIVLGTAVTFWGVGISTRLVKSADDGSMRVPRMWPRYWFTGFVFLSLLLAFEMQFYSRYFKPAEEGQVVPVASPPNGPTIERIEPADTVGQP
jgi:uncharacterized hydrophobic protein (TIGR00271 family)